MPEQDLVDWAEVKAIGLLTRIFGADLSDGVDVSDIDGCFRDDVKLVASALREAYSAGGRDLMLWQIGKR
jgi:hypothetical protein